MSDRMHDRHHIPRPQAAHVTRPSGVQTTSKGAFVDGLKERIHDLFRTQAGLPGHVRQVQQELNRVSSSDLRDDDKLEVGHRAYEQLGKAAEHATFDFAPQLFEVRSIGWSMSVGRVNGKVERWKTN